MELEEQICSLQLAKKLKELNVKQKSYFSWYEWTTYKDNKTEIVPIGTNTCGDGNSYSYFKTKLICSAFTVAELGGMLPHTFTGNLGENNGYYVLGHSYDESGHMITYHWNLNDEDEDKIILVDASTEADARAKMLIYLIENKLINLKGE